MPNCKSCRWEYTQSSPEEDMCSTCYDAIMKTCKVQNIGSKKIFICKCGLEIDRDLNGAKNIYLRNISFALAASPFLS